PIAARVADDQLARGLLEVVGEEEGGAVAAQAGHSNLADRALVAPQPHHLFDVTDLRVTSFGDIDHGLLPGGSGLSIQAPDDRRPAAADGDEMDLPVVGPRQLGVVYHLAVEVKPLGVGAGYRAPELDGAHELARL